MADCVPSGLGSEYCFGSHELSDSWVLPTCTDDEGSGSAVTSKQRELLQKCNLRLRVLDSAFLDAVSLDKKPALLRALEVTFVCWPWVVTRVCTACTILGGVSLA